MQTIQPKWKCLAQLGDVNPIDYGGYWVFTDATGNYPPEAEYLDVPEEEGELNKFIVYRFILDRCTFENGILSDNQFHPDHPAWFADKIGQMAGFTGMEATELIRLFCSLDAIDRAHAYRLTGEYFGFDELDSYPLHLLPYAAKSRYKLARYQTA